MNDPERQATYISHLKLFDKNLVNHFPKKLPNGYFSSNMSSPNSIGEYGNYSGIQISVKYRSKSELNNLSSKYTKQAKYNGKLTDSCLFLVQTSREIVKLEYDLKRSSEFIPVSQDAFYDTDGLYDKGKRNEDLNILVLDWSKKDVLDREMPIPREELPPGWENGFSKGLCFNEKDQTIIYWLIIW